MNKLSLCRIAATLSLCGSLLCQNAAAQSTPSDASALSLVVSVAVPAMFISDAGQYVVKSVEASGRGVVYVLENVSTGVRGSFTVAANVSGALSVGVGAVITFTATSAGMLMVSAGKVLAFIPNEIGKALMKSKSLS